jgi:Zn-dependent M28 family amino/carboxypeptidase
VPVFNTIAEIRGAERPDEYVMMSAHFDSWDGASGATDNGTGTVTMLEAMRILRQVYPNPKRTILVGHWSGEEQGLIGSRAFAADHPEVVRGLQALFNQDNGTGRVVNISGSGLVAASGTYARWLAKLPTEITRHFTNVNFPGNPPGGGSDHASFICHGAPAFGLGALSWDYGTYTWHTNRDTFDKIVFDDLKNNATLVAMLVYLASEDAERVPRERRVMPANPQTGSPGVWPVCQAPPRSSAAWTR